MGKQRFVEQTEGIEENEGNCYPANVRGFARIRGREKGGRSRRDEPLRYPGISSTFRFLLRFLSSLLLISFFPPFSLLSPVLTCPHSCESGYDCVLPSAVEAHHVVHEAR